MNKQCVVCNVHNALCTLNLKVVNIYTLHHAKQYCKYSVRCTLYSVHCVLYTHSVLLYIMYTVRRTVLLCIM